MDSTSKERAETVALTIRVNRRSFRWLDRRRKETGASINHIVRTLIESARTAEQSAQK